MEEFLTCKKLEEAYGAQLRICKEQCLHENKVWHLANWKRINANKVEIALCGNCGKYLGKRTALKQGKLPESIVIEDVCHKYKSEGVHVECLIAPPAINWKTVPDQLRFYFNAISQIDTGGGITCTDVKLLCKIKEYIDATNVFIVGNAFGFSACCFAEIFKNAIIDVIDAEIDGIENIAGSKITRSLSSKYYNNRIRLTIGFSPDDTCNAVLKQDIRYNIVLIDGLHTIEQMVKDFRGIKPYLDKDAFAVVFHDVGLFKLEKGFSILEDEFKELGINQIIPVLDYNICGTGFVAKNLAIETSFL